MPCHRLASATRARLPALAGLLPLLAPLASPQAGAVPAISGPPLVERSVDQLLELAVHVERVLQQRLLAPDEQLVEQYRTLLARREYGIARLVFSHRNEQGRNVRAHPFLLTSGDGSHFSFATRDHSLEAEPDISIGRAQEATMRDRAVAAGQAPPAWPGAFYPGLGFSLLVDLGDVPLEDLPTRAKPLPAWLPPEAVEAWPHMWRTLEREETARGSELYRLGRALRDRDLDCPHAPSTFLLRSKHERGHDHLVAFRPVQRDDEGCTVLWRVLASWSDPIPTEPSREFRHVGAGPRWVAELEDPPLLALLAAIREQARPSLLEVPSDVQGRYRSLLDPAPPGAQRSGIARILVRYHFEPLVESNAGGGCFSFTEGNVVDDTNAEISLLEHIYSLPLVYRCEERPGFLLDLGPLPAHGLVKVLAGERPPGLRAGDLEAWEFLRDLRWSTDRHAPLAAEDASRAAALGLSEVVKATVGHAYLLRAHRGRGGDLRVVFGVPEGDFRGHTLVWRLLPDAPAAEEEERPARRRRER